jgi:ABC-type transport system substrate-binding protein
MDLLKQADSQYDEKKRAEVFKKAQTLMYDSAWMGYIWYELGNHLVNKRVSGFPDQTWGSRREEEWWISG